MADATQAYTSLKQIAWTLEQIQFEHEHGYNPITEEPPLSTPPTPPKPEPCSVPSVSVLFGDLFHSSYYGPDLWEHWSSDTDEGGDALFAELDPTSVDIDMSGWFPPPPPPQNNGVCTIL